MREANQFRRRVCLLLTTVLFLIGPVSAAVSTPARHTAGPVRAAAISARKPSLIAALQTPGRAAAAAVPVVAESFSGSATAPGAWTSFGVACLTAGTSATTPASSVPACGTAAPLDAAGSGALQLTGLAGAGTSGAVIANAPLSTANGLQVTFTDYAFNGSTPGADGAAVFFADASRPFPTTIGYHGGSLGYANSSGTAKNGLPNAYVGIGLDEYGGFSSVGGHGAVRETIAVRGSAANNYPLLGGATNAAGAIATLPFSFDTPSLTTRPTNAPTIRATMTAGGVITVAIDRHDGAGFVTYYSQSIVGVAGQAAVPAQVYFGLSAAFGGSHNVHQIGGLTVTTAAAGPITSATNNPPQIVSANGRLAFNVTVAADPVTGHPQYLYNGSTVPPTLRLLPGDSLVVNLNNQLPAPPAGSAYTNTTNLHYHGLHVSPQAPGDDSIDMLAAPGQSLNYVVQIPTNHPPGLYWYHAHAHGEAERQTLAGMSGALIVDGIAAYTPQVANMVERVLIARDAPLPGTALPNAVRAQVNAMRWAMQHGVAMHSMHSMDGMDRAASMPGKSSADRSEYHANSTARTRNPFVALDPKFQRFVRPAATSSHCIAGSPEQPLKALTLNGQTQPSLRIAPGEQQFWRMANAGADTYLDVQVDNTQMQIVALDGVPLVSGVGTPASMTVSHWVLPPSSRVEFIVTGPPAGTRAFLRTNCFDSGVTGDPMPAAVLATLSPLASAAAALRRNDAVARVSPKAVRFRFHAAALMRARVERSASARSAAAVSTTRTIYYSDQNNINGVAYDPAAPPMFYAQTGTVEEWTIVNNSTQVHTFHIHQVHFVLEAINGITQTQQYVMDNVNVPAATASGPGSVKVLLDFTDPAIIGTFLIHCHILSHEDAGMMAKIRIGTAPPLSLSAANVTFANPTAGIQSVAITGGAAPYSLTGCGGVANAAVNGNTVSILPAAAGACVLTVADASSPSISSTLVIQVNAGPPLLNVAPASIAFSSPSAPSQRVSISGGTAPYTTTGCANIAAFNLNANVVTASALGAGVCSATITDASGNIATLAVSVNATSGGSPLDNLTFHRNAMRTGWYSNETILTTANVNAASFGQIGKLAPPAGMPVLGKVYAQPLFITSERAADGGTHNLVIIAGSSGEVYAFDEKTQAVVWHRSFNSSTVRSQLYTDSTCQDVQPYLGIIGTPVIDRTRDVMYVVVATVDNGTPFLRLHAVGLGSGSDAIPPAVVAGSVAMQTGGVASIDPEFNLNRSALLEANGNIYVALASHCDFHTSSVHGWVMSFSASTLTQTGSLVDLTNAATTKNFYLGSVWMAGYGPAADSAGNVYFATGNGPFDGTNNFGMSVMRVPGNLYLGAASYFTPITQAIDSLDDEDLGSGGVLLLPDQTGSVPHMLVAGGKCSANKVGCFKYLLNRDALGGQQAGNAGALWSADTSGGIWGGPAYFAEANGAQHIIYGTGNPLTTFTLTNSPARLSVLSSANVGCLECRDAGSQPIVSSNATVKGSAVVWAIRTPSQNGGNLSLVAFDPFNLATPLFSAVSGSWLRQPTASYVGGALVSPLVVDGRVYVPGENSVSVFGLLH